MFLGIDGEGKNNADGSHRYTLLACSDGRYISDDAGLRTIDCIDFLLDVAATHKRDKAKLVGFSVDYDINMILSDFYKPNLEELWKTGKTTWIKDKKRYRLEYIPSKHFSCFRWVNNHCDSFTLWDTWGFFQCSFVKALKDWKVGTEETWDRITGMKEQRGDFAHTDDTAILGYCLEECQLLAEMVTKLDTTFKQAGIALSSWQGGGSAAVALLKKHGVKKHVERGVHQDVREYLLHAYFGGRAEVFHLGQHERVYNYDINSAYPAATLSLPTLRGVWRRGCGAYQTGRAYTLCRVSWKLDENILAPFPFRREDGRIAYYRRGAGWYHGVEVDAALALYPPGNITVEEWWEYEPETPYKPFAFVEHYYAERLRYKQAQDMRERPYKLALNSLYGKTAQGVGWEGKVPPYQSYFWSGYITAYTRASILRAIYSVRECMVGIATDGIFTTRQIEGLDIGSGLGQWDSSTYDDFFIAQPGVYVGYNCEKKEIITRNRGFSAKEIDFSTLRREWLEYGIGASVSYEVTRFVKMGQAMPQISKRDYSTWRRWEQSVREVKIGLPHKLEHPRYDGRLTLLSARLGALSAPYTPKAGGWLDWSDGPESLMHRDLDGSE